MNKLARLIVLPDDRGLILGVDKSGIFEKGQIYELREFLGEIIFTPIGECAMPKKGIHPCLYGSDANSIICNGTHLITKNELEEIQTFNSSDSDK